MRRSLAESVRGCLLALCAVVSAGGLADGLVAQSREECLACHSDSSLTMEREGKTISLFADETELTGSTHRKLTCVACHTGFDPNNVPHKERIAPVQCATCHRNADAKHAFHATAVTKGPDPWRLCKECHGTHGVQSPNQPGTKFHSANLVSSCGECHRTVKAAFLQSAHGKALAAQSPNAPSCLHCHSKNVARVTAAQDSVKLKLAQERVCVSCHVASKASAATSASKEFILLYEKSVHGVALKSGNARAANCVDCHGSHQMARGGDPGSRVNRTNIPTTCAQCHPAIAAEFRESIHGTAFISGNNEAPVCTDCHGEHKILAPKDPNSSVSSLHVSAEVCSPCHNSVRLSEKFGLASGRSESFNDSFHGLAVKAGSKEAANCASCHGYHDILPSSDRRSRVHKENLVATCGKCHPGANENFARGSVHILPTSQENGLLYLVSTGYVVLIVVTVGSMFVHNLLDFLKKSKRRLQVRRGAVAYHEVGHALYVRMSLSERLQHGALLVSFITLVITGFMLRFPDAWWVVPIRSLSPAVFEIRGVLHRVAAVALVVASVFHLYYVVAVPQGRQLIRDLMPKRQDIADAWDVMKYNLGLSRAKPQFDRFSYIEKAEYWALVWGTMVMAATGVILWFDNHFLGLIGKLWWDTARTIHYYEAWLATLAIIVWHFYFVIFNPDVYPMNLAWLKGTITEEEMLDEHPRELARIRAEEIRASEEEKETEPTSG